MVSFNHYIIDSADDESQLPGDPQAYAERRIGRRTDRGNNAASSSGAASANRLALQPPAL